MLDFLAWLVASICGGIIAFVIFTIFALIFDNFLGRSSRDD